MCAAIAGKEESEVRKPERSNESCHNTKLILVRFLAPQAKLDSRGGRMGKSSLVSRQVEPANAFGNGELVSAVR